MRTVLTNATLIDCVNPAPVKGAVAIEDGRIDEVFRTEFKGRKGKDHVIDLGGAYLLPGLWDVHIHPDSLPGLPAPEQTIQWGRRLMEGLTESGITGVRCAGAAHFMDVAWKR